MAGEIDDIEAMITTLWESHQATPNIMGMTLGQIKKQDWSEDKDIQKLLSDCKDCSDDCTVVITPWSIAVYEPKDFEVYLEILKNGHI